MDLHNIRTDYNKSNIDFKNLDNNPINFFIKWFEDALSINKEQANSCVLSTVNSNNKPESRVVLLKSVNDSGFVFFTNYNSQKSINIKNNNHVAINFFWHELERQVRIRGTAKKMDEKSSDEYFASRPRESQIGAWISQQSKEIPLDYNFKDELDSLNTKFSSKKIDRPSYWGGYIIHAYKIEFWQGRPSRLHDRILYEFNDKVWRKKRLSP